MRVIDDGGPGGLCVELPLLRDPRRFSPWSRRTVKVKTQDSKERALLSDPCLAN